MTKPAASVTVRAPGALVMVDLIGYNFGGLTHKNALPESYRKCLKNDYHTILTLVQSVVVPAQYCYCNSNTCSAGDRRRLVIPDDRGGRCTHLILVSNFQTLTEGRRTRTMPYIQQYVRACSFGIVWVKTMAPPPPTGGGAIPSRIGLFGCPKLLAAPTLGRTIKTAKKKMASRYSVD